MLALVYLGLATFLGDRICRYFWRARFALQRWASAFLVGILISTWITYLLAILFAFTARPLLWANVSYFVAALAALFGLRQRSETNAHFPGAKKFNWCDAIFLTAFLVIASWLMFGTVSMRAGEVRLASVVWNDFGPNLALMQSFAFGHNFPAEYPYFIGEPIRYHFLFWFQAGNLEFLGLNLAWALNLLSTTTMVALLISIMALGDALFGSRLIGGIAALLLFFHGSLSYLPFLRSQHSLGEVFRSILHLDHWLKSGFPYIGEDWGIWSPSILYVQRHLLGAVGILCLVLNFLVDFYKQRAAVDDPPAAEKISTGAKEPTVSDSESGPPILGFIFSGVLIGLLVFWNSAVFVCSLAVVGGLLLLLPGRGRVATLLTAAVLVGIPQILSLGLLRTTHRVPVFHWGYTIDNPTLWRVLVYLLFTFGPKLALAIVALFLVRRTPRAFALAITGLVALAFCTQLNVEIMNNQKFLYVWLVLLNLFVACALVRIYRARIAGKIAAVLLGIIVIAGGAIEIFRIHNDNWIDVPFRQNALSNWLLQNTKPTDVFLTERFVHHPILMNGRRIFYGWPYFPWSMGYGTAERDEVYKQILTEENPDKLIELLKRNRIDYVAMDDGLRNSFLHVGNREELFASRLPKVFEDTEKRFGRLNIYRVPR